MKTKSIHWASLAVLVMVFMIAGRANACTVEFDGFNLLIQNCGDADDVITVYVEDVASGDTLVPSLFVDIGDGADNQGDATNLSSVIIQTVGGSDDVSILKLDAVGGVLVETGPGPDKVSVGPNVSVGDVLTIRTGSGGDAVALGLGVSASIGVKVSTRSGSDVVTTVAADPLDIGGVSTGGNIVINGGDRPDSPGLDLVEATDTIVIGDDSLKANGRVRLLGFESFGFGVNSSDD